MARHSLCKLWETQSAPIYSRGDKLLSRLDACRAHTVFFLWCCMWAETPKFCKEGKTKKYFERLCSSANAARLLQWWVGDVQLKIAQLKLFRGIFTRTATFSKAEFKRLRPEELDVKSTLYELLTPLFLYGETDSSVFLTHLLTLLSFPTRLQLIDTDDLTEEMLAKYIAEEVELHELDKVMSDRERELLDKMRHKVYKWFKGWKPSLHKPQHTNGATAAVKRGDGMYAKYLDISENFCQEAYNVLDTMEWNPVSVFPDLSCSHHAQYRSNKYPESYKDAASWRFPHLFDMIGIPYRSFDPCYWDTVPKGIDKRRGISYEVSWRSYCQKLVGDSLKHHMADIAEMNCDLFDQSPNQRLCAEGARTGQYATVDLSSASDRVRWSHICYIFQDVPLVLDMLDLCRAPSVSFEKVDRSIPDMELAKHAPMGSATCFPGMCTMLSALISVVLEEQGIRDRYGVYGDDCVIPVTIFDAFCEALESLGMVVNYDKSFSQPYRYRESCGIECHGDKVVTPLYISRTFDIAFIYKREKNGKLRFKRTVEHYEGLAALCGRLELYGYDMTRKILLHAMLEVYPLTPFSRNYENGIHSFSADINSHLNWSMRPCARYDSESTRIPMVKTYKVDTSISRTPPEFRYGLKLEQLSFRDERHIPCPQDRGSAHGGKVYTRLKVAWIPASLYE